MRKFEKISKEQWDKDMASLIFYKGGYDDIKLPQRATSKSAGYDLYSPIEISISPQEQVMIPTGLKVNMEDDDVMLIVIRSSLGIKKGITIPNQVGVIDSDYYNNIDNEGHFWVCLRNNSDEIFNIEIGDRISQAIFVKYSKVDDDLPIKESRDGGFGSTNKKGE